MRISQKSGLFSDFPNRTLRVEKIFFNQNEKRGFYQNKERKKCFYQCSVSKTDFVNTAMKKEPKMPFFSFSFRLIVFSLILTSSSPDEASPHIFFCLLAMPHSGECKIRGRSQQKNFLRLPSPLALANKGQGTGKVGENMRKE